MYPKSQEEIGTNLLRATPGGGTTHCSSKKNKEMCSGLKLDLGPPNVACALSNVPEATNTDGYFRHVSLLCPRERLGRVPALGQALATSPAYHQRLQRELDVIRGGLKYPGYFF